MVYGPRAIHAGMDEHTGSPLPGYGMRIRRLILHFCFLVLLYPFMVYDPIIIINLACHGTNASDHGEVYDLIIIIHLASIAT